MPHIHLTFDDGPDPQWTPRVLDVLAAHGMRATFFVIGRAALAHAALLRRVVAAGHEVGNHTWSHRHPWTLTRTQAVAEVEDGTRAIAEATGRTPHLFRPPHGRLRRCMVQAARDKGQRMVLWTRSAIDWGPRAHAASIHERLQKARDGDIVLMHDAARSINRPEQLLAVLPEFLQWLQERGWAASPLPEDQYSGDGGEFGGDDR
ncbi:MAG: polysaccharide deacetylase family protein [Burkholderiales bacterium]|nr:polysaccharide deacetylase family protein [Burkholderiales bacterium]